MGYAEKLGVTNTEFEELLEHTEQRTYQGREYRLLPDPRRGIEQGTVLIDGTIVRGYPSISRVLVLETGIESFFDGTFVVEEKLNGYNVRIADVDGVLAFTRSGYACPFTTHHIERLLDPAAFFEDHPDLVLCGEMYGPENPYTSHDYPDVDSVGVQLFDIRDRVTGEPLPVKERQQLCDTYGFPAVTTYGQFTVDEVGAVREIIDDLDEQNREGIVMKSLDGSDQLKYTTSAANQGSLAYAFGLPFEYGRDFVFGRLVREAFQAIEWDESRPEQRERAREVGESILLPMIDTIQTAQAGDAVGERFTIRGEPEILEAMLAQLRELGLTIDVEREYTTNGDHVVEFTKRSATNTDKIRYYLDGGLED